MTAYQTVVVGTDGSESSLRAVERAGKIASESNGQLIIVTGYFPQPEDSRAADILGDESYKVRGSAPTYAMLREAHDRAKMAGAKNIEERAIQGAAVDALVDLAEEVLADLLVVGNVGLTARSAIIGRVFSVPGSVANRANVDVLIVHTAD
jgi:nucleotide-binding universal stress UspA family protein